MPVDIAIEVDDEFAAEVDVGSLRAAAEAAKAADAIKAVAYPASLAELKGDLAMLSGKSDAAADFYRLALQQLSADAGSRGLIEMKLTDAGGSADKPKEIR